VKSLIFTLTVILTFNVSQAQVPLIAGQKQGMMFTDIEPDMSYSCSWAYGMRTCWKSFAFDVNHDGVNDFNLSHSYVECMYYTFKVWTLQPVGNVEFVVDSMGLTPFDEGDTIGAGSNFELDYTTTYIDMDTNYNPIYDTTFFIRNARWLDTANLIYNSRVLSQTGAASYCPPRLNWELERGDTNFVAFRLIENADTAYGWLKLITASSTIIGESFAVSGDTGSYTYTAVEALHDESEPDIYPNPVSDRLTIEAEMPDNVVEIFSLEGKKQLHVEAARKAESIDVSLLSPGFYMVNITAGNKTTTKRFIKE
jgi:hypothetical protein